MRWRCMLCFLALFAARVINVQARQVHNHVSSICSTWGSEHFKTFDGDVYQFPGMCEYNLVSDCHESYQEFSVHLRRTVAGGNPTVSYVAVTINDLLFHLTKTNVQVNGVPIKMPYYNAGVQVEQNAVYVKVQAKVGVVVMWNGDDAVMVELETEYANRTCGLCGDFNGVPVYNEFIQNGRKISPIEFGNKQKVHHPNDECEDPYEDDAEAPDALTVRDECKELQTTCEQMLRSASWSSCTKVLNPEPYIQACVQGQCSCTNSTDDFCVCSTLSEYSRQCSHAGGQPPNWRTPQFCAKQCPFNMVYEESGSPCMDTCTLRDTSSLCEDHKMDGCFCPDGMVFDDISMRGCIAQSECQCKHNKIYNAGEVYQQDIEECTCFAGRWACKSLQIPGTCAVEEGSHVTTFDGKTYTFHGDCYYILAKVESKDVASPKFTILAQMVPCVNRESDTCLKTLSVLLNNDRNNILTFTADGNVKHNMQMITLPYHTGDINIFQASSFHILLQTRFGLQIQVQHVPVVQVYVSLEQSYKAKTRGLCGNYNMVLSDDMKTPQEMVEGTAATFGNSWKVNLMCPDKGERSDDPCSLSVENERYAKHWCTLLQSSNSTFTRCHSAVDPDVYYKRCTYASCNCEKSEDCLCAVFSSYARACASKGVFLTNWRENVCDKYTRSCPASQTFSYKLQRCQMTCRSLGSGQQSCTSDFLPVDGCSCPDGLYLDDNGICLPVEKCPCYHNGRYIKAGKSINIKEDHCVCNNGKLHCHSWKARSSTCPVPKVFFNCSTAGTGQLGVQCARTCLNLHNAECYFTECESGCQCPSGLIDDGKGSCVREHECPCQHNRNFYTHGTQIPVQCNNCTCKSGTWECTKKKCPGTCVIYGSGHYNTFDQQAYGFQGQCAYVAVKNKCGNKTVQDNFQVITENMPCGSTGTTCSKTIRIQLGRTEIKLSKGTYEEKDRGNGTYIQYRIRKVGMYLVIESAIGLVVMWDNKTTLRIMLEPQHSGEVCGLCGDFDGDGKNDFITQTQLTVSNVLEFANSWKVSSSCPDAQVNPDSCGARPNREHWAKRMCSIIEGNTFSQCHSKVDYVPFYDNCVKDSCACDSGGDCECFCTAVAAYAQACNEAGVCVAWRTPEICPVFCDYYNGPDECNWHYSPCHTPCYKTCYNPQGICSNPIPHLEGCYPICPENKPIFDEKSQTCVEICDGCFYNGTYYKENEVIYDLSDNMGMCYYAICINKTVIHTSAPCSTTNAPTTERRTTTTAPTTPTTPTTTTTPTTKRPTTPSTTPTGGSSPTICIPKCEWSEWYDVHDAAVDKSDWETYENITNSGKEVCDDPRDIECRSTLYPDMDFEAFVDQTKQVVTCNVSYGLICREGDQLRPPRKCFNYKIRVECCHECFLSTTTTPVTTTEEPTTITTTTPEPSTTTKGPTPTTPPTIPTSTTQGPTTPTTPPTKPTSTTQGPTTMTTTTTQEPTTPTTPPTKPTSTTQGPTTMTTTSTTTTQKPTTPTTPPTKPTSTTQGPTTMTTTSTTTTQEPTTPTTPPTKPPSTTQGPTTMTSTSTTTTQKPTSPTTPPTKPTSTTQGPTTMTTTSTTTTQEPTTPTTPPTKPTSTTQGPTTMTTTSTTTTQEPTTPTAPPTKPTSTTQGPTTMTTTSTTTTQEPTTPTTPPTKPTTTQKPTTPTTPPTKPTSTTQGPTTMTTTSTTTTQEPTTPTTRPTKPTSTTQGPTTMTTTSTTTTQEPTTPTTRPTKPTSTTQGPTTMTTTSTEPTTTPEWSSTTECLCIFDGKQFKPGDTIIDMIHIGSGICLTIECSGICEIANHTGPCRPTPTPPPVVPTPTPSPVVPTCPEWDVVQNETFILCNCTMARCIENYTIEIVPYECPPLENITCANGKIPVLVYDEHQCCQYYACDCVCEGWGDPHYITFDGLYYSYQGNCTYVLMEEIFPKHNLKVFIDNVYCDPTEDVSCPRSIIVSYGSQVITLKNHNLIGAAQLEAIKDGEPLKLPYSHPGKFHVKVMNSGINMVLEIPRLKVVVTFGVTGFSVTLPFQYFGRNTQGHCGTCNNNQTDDCTLPLGQLVQNCAVMADYWPANDIYQPNCPKPPVVPTDIPTPPSTQSPCKPDSICDLLKSSVFAECHPVVLPDKFYQGCVFDSCNVANPVVQCTSLQAYAAACAQAGVCLYWRNHTTLCASDCPSNKVYKPCGPAEPPSCEDNLNETTFHFTTEGCFCPDGMKLFNHESGICVDKCGCLDPQGIPREFNEKFEYNCQNCMCEESTKAIICQPKVCPAPPMANCSSPGFIIVSQPNPRDPCCPAYVCQCDSNTCPAFDMSCPVGYMPTIFVPEGKCCPQHTCDPKRVCVHKNIEYEIGAVIPEATCQDCICSREIDPNTGLFKKICEFQHCKQDCELGYEYVETDPYECCGKCIQTHCVLSVNGTKKLLMQGELWSPPENKCEHYTCVKNGATFTTITSHILCPLFQQSNCQPDTIQTAANGCCKVCVEKEKACKLVPMRTHVLHQGCQSVQEVDMPYCEGSCNTFTKYSEIAAAMQQSCSCCKETHSSNRTVDLHCLNGDVVPYTYTHVEECGCSHTDCTKAPGRLTRKKRSFTLL
ncbi:hypothetical protein LDENG_00009980 [Lucifuga dentata]|nr:hypothetical protein LDENG_00009980 [Lucifuga dentata]